MAALHDELITAIRSLRAFLIRKVWSTASIEKSHQITDSFDVTYLLTLIQSESQYNEIWKYFASLYLQRDVQYLNLADQKNLYSLIRLLKNLEEHTDVDPASFINIFTELKLKPASNADISLLSPNIENDETPIVEIEEIDVIETKEKRADHIEISTDISPISDLESLPVQDLQDLILSINDSGNLPANISNIIAPYESALKATYSDAPTYSNSVSNNEKITIIIKITDFFVISEQTNFYTITNNFNDDLLARYSLLAQHHYYHAVNRLKNSAKDDAKFLKDVLDIVSAAKSQLLFTPSNDLAAQLTTFTESQSFDLAVTLLNSIHDELSFIVIQKPDPIITKQPEVSAETIENAEQNTQSNKKHPYFLDGYLEPTLKESPKYDDELTQELRESFKEEAELEIFPLIHSATTALKSKPYKEADILDLRRAFHTLKGSGYTASFPIIGEMGWQVERVINGVRDNLYPFNEAILHHALDGYDAINARFIDPTYQDNELQRLTYQA